MAQAPLESLGGILATTVAMVDQSRQRALAGSGQIEGGGRQLNKEIFATVMSDDPTRAAVKGEGQVKPTLSGFDVGDIALPDAARSIWRRHLGKPVFRNLVFVSTISRTGPENGASV